MNQFGYFPHSLRTTDRRATKFPNFHVAVLWYKSKSQDYQNQQTYLFCTKYFTFVKNLTMKKLSEIVEEEIKRSPFLMESLREGLINISSLARKIQKPVEKIIGKGVKSSAIIMAINRLPIQVEQKQEPNLVRFISKLRDVRVRSNIVDYTFVASGTLIHAQASLLARAAELPKSFHSISQGVTETTILVDESLENDLIQIFRKEKCIERERDLTVLTFLLPAENRVLYGFYYFILREFAWNGINLVEVISTSNEFTLVVSTKDLDAAFKVLSTLRNG